MKLGLGLYKHMLSEDYYDFARQAGCSHVVVHLVDYFSKGESNERNNQPTGARYDLWGRAGDPEAVWSVSQLKTLRKDLERSDLSLAAIENIDPALWHDILLDGPKRSKQMEQVKTIIRNMGEAGIPVLGYNFSIAGVCGRTSRRAGRGGAVTLGMDGPSDEFPIPAGAVWNMIYDDAPSNAVLPDLTHAELWSRLERFLEEVVPEAEKAGVRLAAHPDDPPMPTMRQQPRLVYQPDMYQRLLDVVRSPSNALELCVGTVAEMTEGDVYDAVDKYSGQGQVAYMHLRNVAGKVPYYRETFIDEGDVDMFRVLSILHRNKFEGVLIPDHSPQMSCSAPWHAGMAHTLGFMAACVSVLDKAADTKTSGLSESI